MILNPYAEVEIASMIATFNLLQEPPLCYFVPLKQINDESASSLSGRYLKHRGAAVGTMRPKLQDTYLQGSTGRTGRAFDIIQGAGNWKDGNKPDAAGKYRLIFSNGAAGGVFEVVAHAPTVNIENAQIIVGRGVPGSGVTYTSANFNCYLHLCYGQKQDFRIPLEWSGPIRLERTTNYGGAWSAVDIAADLGDWHRFNQANGFAIPFAIHADYNDNSLSVEVGHGNFLYFAPNSGNLPTGGNIRLVGLNGYASLEYYPLRGDVVKATKGTRDFGRQMPNAQHAFLVGNSVSNADPALVVTPTITTDGQKFDVSLTGKMPDAGDGLGSATPALITDFSVVMESAWHDGSSDDPRYGLLPAIRVEELQVFDTITRTVHSSAMVTASNRDKRYAGAYGHVAGQITASNNGGITGVVRLFGVGGVGRGVRLSRHDPVRLIDVPFSDRSYVMGRDSSAAVPLDQEVIFDGWDLYCAVRFLAECGNIHPRYLDAIPLYIPPGATRNAPYGPAGYDCPADHPILPRGTGLNALYRELPDRTIWSILQELVQDSGITDPYTGGIAPFYTGFDTGGNLHFEPIFWSEQVPVIAYSSLDPSGFGQIEEISTYNSASEMRTRIDLQGIDPRTYELLYQHIAMPDAVLQAVGFNFGYLDRSARYSGAYMAQVANSIAVQAAQPQTIIRIRVPFHPEVFAGNLCYITEGACVGGTELCVIEEMYSAYGMQDVAGRGGTRDCYSIVTARPLRNVVG